jgi:hypothetical protein
MKRTENESSIWVVLNSSYFKVSLVNVYELGQVERLTSP